MTIAIYLHPYGEKKPAGLARTVYETARSIIAADQTNQYVILLKHKPEHMPEFPGTNWRVQILGHKYLWLTRKFKAISSDICVFFTPILPIFHRPKRSVVVVCD